MRFKTVQRKTGKTALYTLSVMLCAILVSLSLPASSTAAASRQKTFSSPEKAVQALVDSLKNNDKAELRAVLGPSGGKLTSTGDPIVDRQHRDIFLAAYEEMHRFDQTGKSKAILVIGKDEWPFPIPLVAKNKRWRFDTEAGKQEILDRWIGRNELETIQTCLAIVDAQREYAMGNDAGNDFHEYAAKFASDPGKKNGLYWKTGEGEPPSPLGELVARAKAEGYSAGKSGGPIPYHGYFYRILTRQGKHAAGGAFDYMVHGHMIGGFAVVAYPASYGSSGVMTFIVNHDGVVYQKDLGRDTAVTAKMMDTFDPGPGWNMVEQTASK
ncbi:MAG TPA: DUF2950 domain-containing protein [Geobacteraceae bacterium]|nr:DUF2950 domain-containing protein [Geobacteraceae bacterium]